ncbi:MAG: polyphosphate:AMP phosphotransferase [Rhodospirillaceae bacterium]|nr:polyphosphate:AMP phosphotransferase [Rhodospirillaceae bacterium]
MAEMFKIAEIGAALPKQAFAVLQSRLRLELIQQQQTARMRGRPTLIVLNGVRGAGVIDTVNLLNTWMDPRWISTIGFDTPSDEERERPPFWRYWRSLPAAGAIGLYLGGWYAEALAEKCAGTLPGRAFQARLARINAFERMLAAEGMVILKFWLHVSEHQHKILLPRINRDPLIGFRASDNTWTMPTDYTRFTDAAAGMIRATSHEHRPWFLVEGTDDNYRRASVLSALAGHWTKELSRAPVPEVRPRHVDAKENVLKSVGMGRTMTDKVYAKAFHRLQLRLHNLQQKARERGVSTIVVFEGWDAAGKGGAIRRLTYAMNARDYRVVPTAAPNDEERSYHYLWRFWRQLGRAGRMTVFDRSWYGRVLVERVEKLIGPEAWSRAYGEINDFERQLTDCGHIVVKIWLHISKDEQKKRFKERRDTPYKTWKLTDDDWRNRRKWKDYARAVSDMIANTSTATSPWTLIGANDKQRARIKALTAVADAMARGLKRAQ